MSSTDDASENTVDTEANAGGLGKLIPQPLMPA